MFFSMPLLFLTIENDEDRDFVETLYHDYKKLMWKQAKRFQLSDDLIEDMIQQSIVRIINNLQSIYKINCYALPSYIVHTVRSVCIDYLRQGKTNKTLFLDDVYENFENNLHDTSYDEEEHIINTLSAEELSLSISELSERDYFILKAKYLLEYDNESIAKLIGVKTSSIRVLLSRARKRALKKFGEKDVTE